MSNIENVVVSLRDELERWKSEYVLLVDIAERRERELADLRSRWKHMIEVFAAAKAWRAERKRIDADSADLNARFQRGETVVINWTNGVPPEVDLAKVVDAAIEADEE